MKTPHRHSWMRYVLLAAALYNVAWGGFTILAPNSLFRWAGIPLPNYPQLWQCVGMLVGVYGIAYAAAALDPVRHWPVIMAGLLGKVFGLLGFLLSAFAGGLPWKLGWLIAANDLIWWIPFSLILRAAYRAALAVQRVTSPEVQLMALRAKTQYGESLSGMSAQRPLLLVFLRHAGCTFCREALADIAGQRPLIEATGARIAFIHMSPDTPDTERFFARYGLADVPRVSDRNRHLYRAFGLTRGGFEKVFGPRVLWRAFFLGALGRHGIGLLAGDGFQMPGVFLLYRGAVVRSYRHQSVADRPDYLAFTSLDSLPV